MAIPLLIGAGAAALFGIKKMVDASENNDMAEYLYDEAKEMYENAQNSLEQQREQTKIMLDSLATTKLNVQDKQISQYVSLFNEFEQLDNELKGHSDRMGSFQPVAISEIARSSEQASEIIKAGVGSLAAGALTGIAAYGGVGMLASTAAGTAIAGLHGAAAANATLAWLGGGAASIGGLGVAGGTAVLGGIALAPVIAVFGMFKAAKSEENLAAAEKAYAEAENAATKMNTMTDVLRNMYDIADDYNDFILRFAERLNQINRCLALIVSSAKERVELISNNSFFKSSKKKLTSSDLTDMETQFVHFSWVCVQIMSGLLKKPLLNESGSVDPSAKTLLIEAENHEECTITYEDLVVDAEYAKSEVIKAIEEKKAQGNGGEFSKIALVVIIVALFIIYKLFM